MPEGHTVHRVAKLFRDEFVGTVLRASSPQGRFAEGAQRIDGSQMHASYAVGKQLFCEFSAGWVLRVHLGIYGAWSIHRGDRASSIGAPRRQAVEEGLVQSGAEDFPPPPRGQVRLRLYHHDVVADLRGPTACELMTPEQAEEFVQTLGPDPLVGNPLQNRDRFIQLMSGTSTPIAGALMNQKLVSGIGNVYRAELLFRHRLDPYQPTKSLGEEVLGALWDDWSVLLKRGVRDGVMVTRDDLSASGRRKALRDKSWRHFVYQRAGQPCLVCASAIVMSEFQNRKLYYCPGCQSGEGAGLVDRVTE